MQYDRLSAIEWQHECVVNKHRLDITKTYIETLAITFNNLEQELLCDDGMS